MASPVPVLPEVGSTIVPPGRNRPSRSAASIIATATRSLIEPPGLRYSTLATSWDVRPAPKRDSRTSGVQPIASRIEDAMAGAVGDETVGARMPLILADVQRCAHHNEG